MENVVDVSLLNRISTFETFLTTLTPELNHKFFETWSLSSILRLRRVSSQLKAAVENYMEESWDFNEFFNPWFDNPVEFRQILFDTQSIVTGSQALCFLRRSRLPRSDLNIIIPVEVIIEFGIWLVEDEGYEYDSAIIGSRRIQRDNSSGIVYAMSSAISLAINATLEDSDYRPIRAFNFIRGRRIEGRYEFMTVQLLLALETAIEEIFSFHSSKSSRT